MSHPFGDLLAQHLHRKHGLSQAKLAAGIVQTPSIISEMSQGKRLHGPQARERVTAIITWLQQQGALTTLDEANALLNAAGMAPLQERAADEARLIHNFAAPAGPSQRHGADMRATIKAASSSTPRHNLPTQLTPFIGRTEQIAQLVEHLQTHRLLTLTGAGGVGKTRLAIEVATRVNVKFADGVWFIDLAPLTDANAIPQRILDLWRVPEQPERSPLEALTAYLHTKAALLILDNCEHLIGGCAALAETLLRHCPHLSLLTTSREALNIGGETTWRVPSLTRPPAGSSWEGHSIAVRPAFTPATLADFEAVTLFVERAAVRQPGFALTATNAPAVAQICSRLDGIPLALEMAAARINIFTVEEMAKRLDGAFDGRFQMLTSGTRTAPLRHQTLRATLEWSYGLLTAKEQWSLVCLSVFSGGWSFDAAKEVTRCSLDQLAQLVNKSLVIADQQAGQTRYRLLETVRQFAHAQLVACGEQDEIRQRHAAFFLALAEAAEPRLFSSEQMLCVRQLETEMPNLRAALIWFQQMDIEDGLRLANALWYMWLIRDDLSEGRQWLEALLAKEVGTVITKARATWRAASLAEAQGDLRQMAKWAAAAANFARAADDKLSLGNALILLGNVAVGVHEDSARAEVLYKDALHLFNEVEPEPGYWSALALEMLGDLTDVRGNFEQAARLREQTLALRRKSGDVWVLHRSLRRLAILEHNRGNYERASTYYHEGLALAQQSDYKRHIAVYLEGLGDLLLQQGKDAQALNFYQESLTLGHTVGHWGLIEGCLLGLARIARHQACYAQAQSLLEESLLYARRRVRTFRILLICHELAYLAQLQGNYAQALGLYKECIPWWQKFNKPLRIASVLRGVAAIAGASAQLEVALRLYGAEATIRNGYEHMPSLDDDICWSPAEQKQWQQSVVATRLSLDEPSATQAWAAGQALTVEEVVAYLLASPIMLLAKGESTHVGQME